MKLLLTSSGVPNPSIQRALVELLGKPIADSSALIIPTAMYPFPGGGRGAYSAVTGARPGSLPTLGWSSLGILELTALPTIDESAWVPMVRETDALLVWGGDPLYLAHRLRESGLAALLPSLRDTVYVGVSAGSIAATATFAETYPEPPRGTGEYVNSEPISFDTPSGQLPMQLVSARGIGLVPFGVIPHYEHPEHQDASESNAAKWAAHIPAPTYAIDDASAIKVVDTDVEVVSEGRWKLFDR